MKKMSGAEHADIQRRLLLLSMLFLSSVFAVKIAAYFADEYVLNYLKIAAVILFGLFALTLVITVFWKLKFIPRNERYQLLNTGDSYVNQMMNKAFKISWLLSLILLFFIRSISKENTSEIPAKFYLDLSVFLLLASFSISSLILFRAGNKEENEKAGI